MHVVPLKSNAELIINLEALLDRCRSGEVIAIHIVEELQSVYHMTSYGSCPSNTAIAGMFLHAAIDCLVGE